MINPIHTAAFERLYDALQATADESGMAITADVVLDPGGIRLGIHQTFTPAAKPEPSQA